MKKPKNNESGPRRRVRDIKGSIKVPKFYSKYTTTQGLYIEREDSVFEFISRRMESRNNPEFYGFTLKRKL